MCKSKTPYFIAIGIGLGILLGALLIGGAFDGFGGKSQLELNEEDCASYDGKFVENAKEGDQCWIGENFEELDTIYFQRES